MKRTLLTLTLLTCTLPAWATTVVDLREQAVVRGAEWVRLADVAEIRGDAAASLSRLFLGPAPETGREDAYTRQQVQQRLADAGFRGVTVTGGVVRVRTATAPQEAAAEPAAAPAPTTFSSEQSEQVFAAATARHVARLFPRPELQVDARIPRLQERLPLTAARVQVLELIRGQLPGRARLRFAVLDASEQILSRPELDVEVDATAPVPVLRRGLRKGEIVLPSDLVVARVALDPQATYAPLAATELVGRAAARTLRAQQPLTPNDLEEPLAVTKGQLVEVDTMAGGFRIRMHARAAGNARVGELLEVENLDPKAEKKSFPARAVRPGVVEVVRFGR